MSSTVPFAPYFFDENTAYAFVEGILWRGGRVCPHCGSVDRSGKLGGKSTRPGLFKCYNCRKPFTVKLGTLFESSNVKLHLWLRALYLLCSSRNRVSSARLCECLGVTAKTAWSVRRRIVDAMRKGTIPAPLVAAFSNIRPSVPSSSGFRKTVNPVQRSWSSAWNMVVEQDRYTVSPSFSKPERRAWSVGQVEGAHE